MKTIRAIEFQSGRWNGYLDLVWKSSSTIFPRFGYSWWGPWWNGCWEWRWRGEGYWRKMTCWRSIPWAGEYITSWLRGSDLSNLTRVPFIPLNQQIKIHWMRIKDNVVNVNNDVHINRGFLKPADLSSDVLIMISTQRLVKSTFWRPSSAWLHYTIFFGSPRLIP